MMSMSASLLRKADVAVAVSFSGQNLSVVDAVRQAQRNGAKIIAITNHSSSILAQEANFAFSASADECPLTGETASARVAQLAIVDALFMAVARINPAATEANLGCTISAIRAQRGPW